MTTTYSYYYKPRPFLGSEIMTKFRDLEQKEIVGKQDDVYAKNYVPKKYSKMSSEYGTPKPGTLTEKRAKKAGKSLCIVSESSNDDKSSDFEKNDFD